MAKKGGRMGVVNLEGRRGLVWGSRGVRMEEKRGWHAVEGMARNGRGW